MRLLDPRLLRRARAVRVLLVARRCTRRRRGAARPRAGSAARSRGRPLVRRRVARGGRDTARSSLVAGRRGAGARGVGLRGRRPAGRGDVLSELRLDVVEARLRRQPAALDGAAERGGRDRRRLRRRRARDDVRALPPAGRSRRRRPDRGARPGRVDRPPRGRRHAPDAPARARCSCGSSGVTRSDAHSSAGRRSRCSRTTSSTSCAGCRRCARSTASKRAGGNGSSR